MSARVSIVATALVALATFGCCAQPPVPPDSPAPPVGDEVVGQCADGRAVYVHPEGHAYRAEGGGWIAVFRPTEGLIGLICGASVDHEDEVAR